MLWNESFCFWHIKTMYGGRHLQRGRFKDSDCKSRATPFYLMGLWKASWICCVTNWKELISMFIAGVLELWVLQNGLITFTFWYHVHLFFSFFVINIFYLISHTTSQHNIHSKQTKHNKTTNVSVFLLMHVGHSQECVLFILHCIQSNNNNNNNSLHLYSAFLLF